MINAVRYAAFNALRVAIETAVPALATRTAIAPMPNHVLGYPALEIIPMQSNYLPEQAVLMHPSTPREGQAIMDVGVLETVIQLQLAYATRQQRAEIEDAILEFFLSITLRAGVPVLSVSTPTVGLFYASFSLDSDLWSDQAAFIPADQRHVSTLALTAEVPALAIRSDAYLMHDLQLGIGQTLDDPLGWNAPDVDHFRVNPDGTLTPI